MMKKLLTSSILFVALSAPSFAATAEFYVAQDAKSHACMVSDKKPDGKMMMDAGNKSYASEANAKQAMAALKACAPAAAVVAPAAPAKAAAPAAAAPAAPAKAAAPAAMAAPAAAGFYVEQDAKTHKCMVDSKAPDGKMMMDVGTKVYETKGRAEQAMGMLKACKS